MLDMTAQAKPKTRDKILEKALELFNEFGTTAVTTNHISAAMGISPGNLYYHFRNREEIIREIFKMMGTESSEGFGPIVAQIDTLGLQVFEETFRFIQHFNQRFIFFKRELPTLIMRDSELKAGFHKVHQETLGLSRSLVDGAIAAGILRPLDEEEKQLLAEMSWMLTLFWPNYQEITKQDNAPEMDVERGIAMIRLLVHSFKTTP